MPARPPAQDAAEAERNRNWDPNSALAGKQPGAGRGVGTGRRHGRAAADRDRLGAAGVDPAAARRQRGPADAAGGRRSAAPAAAAQRAGAAGRRRPLAAGGDPFTYFVQAGAFARSEDAEQQRARLAMLGVESRLTEREQGGRTVYRVRVGPFDTTRRCRRRQGKARRCRRRFGAGRRSEVGRVRA